MPTKLLAKLSRLTKPNIFSYTDFKKFIQDQVDYLKQEEAFNLKKFMKTSGLKSKGYLGMVIRGERVPEKLSVHQIGYGLSLKDQEIQYLFKLVRWVSAETSSEKEKIYQDILSVQHIKMAKQVNQAQHEFFSHWFMSPLLEILGTDFKNRSHSEIAKALGISADELLEALTHLKTLGLLKESNSGGWERIDAVIDTPVDGSSENLRKFHKEMSSKASEILQKLDPSQRFFTSLSLSLSPKSYEVAVQKIERLIGDLASLSAEEKSAEKVFVMNFQLFPVVSLSDKAPKE